VVAVTNLVAVAMPPEKVVAVVTNPVAVAMPPEKVAAAVTNPVAALADTLLVALVGMLPVALVGFSVVAAQAQVAVRARSLSRLMYWPRLRSITVLVSPYLTPMCMT
jgi:hypothetical protein